MSNTLTLRIFALGHARVYRGERELTMRDWTYSKSKELLLFLAAHPPRTKGEIGEALWPDATAAQLSSNFRVVVLYLRHALGGREWIPFADERYTFNRTLPYEFDVERFDERVKGALRVKATAPARATALLQEAIQLYQGDFCADLPDGTWHMARQAELSRRYLDALLVLAQLHLAERRFAPAVEAYRAAIAKDNYREAAHRGLMRCLAQMGERAQAIQHYHALVNMLRDELRQTPEPETTALFERLQRGDESALTPFQAPPRHTRFVGRERELAELRAEFTQAAANIVGLIGMGGIGKTTLATQLAHALRAQFPDGVLWAHVATSEPMAILDSWARAFQCDYSGLPDLDSRAAAMRSLLADKHALLILDDVWDAERARPLLLGGPHCRVLLTSRNREVIVALDAQLLAVPTLNAADGSQLIERIIGAKRAQAESEAVEEMCALLGYLPLALEISAKRLESHPRWPLTEMLARLRDQFKRLDELTIADKAVRASFAFSWELLDEPQRHVFAHLGVLEGRTFTATALTAIAAVERRVASEGLDALVALSLLSPHGTVRYQQHPLLADFAREQLGDGTDARGRMQQYYLDFATEHEGDYLALEDNWENMAAGLQAAHQQQRWQNVIAYTSALTPAWFARGRYSDARQAYPLALEAAARPEIEEQEAYIAATIHLGRAFVEQGDYSKGEVILLRGLQVAEEVDDRQGIADAKYYLGWSAYTRKQHGDAQQWYTESLTIKRQLDDPRGVAQILYRQGQVLYDQQQYPEAEQLAQQALAILSAANSKRGAIPILSFLAQVANGKGELDIAEQYAQQALQLCEETQEHDHLAWTLYVLSGIKRRQGQLPAARAHADRSLTFFQRMGDRNSQGQTLFDLSRISFELESHPLALDEANRSLRLFRDLHSKWAEVYVLRHIGDIHLRATGREQAIATWSEALSIGEEINHPLCESIRERIAKARGTTD